MRKVLALLLVTALAEAAPSKAELKQAGRRFKEGDSAYKMGDFATAIPAFEDAFRISEDPFVLFNIAQCYRKQYEVDQDFGRLIKARELYKSFIRNLPDSPLKPDAEMNLADVEALIAAGPKKAQPTVSDSNPIEAARKLYDQADYTRAMAALDQALTTPRNSRESLIDIYKLRALVASRGGKADDARESFKRLLAIDASYVLSETAEATALGAYAEAKAFWAGKTPPSVMPNVPGKAAEGQDLKVDPKVGSDPLAMVAGFETLVRVKGAREFGRYSGMSIPATQMVAPGVEVVVLAVDTHGGTIASGGTLDQPLAVQVIASVPGRGPGVDADAMAVANARPEGEVTSQPLYKKWWVWAAAGAVVVGAVVGIVVATSGGGEGGTSTEPSPEPCFDISTGRACQ
ncbi:MAG: tetratricopeptide repeat protein [Myxococcota bacterium]